MTSGIRTGIEGMERLIETVYEDAELLVVNKPAGLVCHPTKTDGYSSLISRVRLHLGEEMKAHLINRLDRETSGLVLVAKRDDAARELRQIWETRAARKEYLAIVRGHVCADHDVIDAPIGKDRQSAVVIKDCVRRDGASAQTGFHVERRFTRTEGEFTLLRVVPGTGRKHQIRIHLAHYGHPIVGDKIYGGDENLYLDFVRRQLTEEQRRRLILPHHALHARSLRFLWRNSERAFKAEPEGWFTGFAGRTSS